MKRGVLVSYPLASLHNELKNQELSSKNSLRYENGLEGIRTPGRSVKSRLLHLAELQAQKLRNHAENK